MGHVADERLARQVIPAARRRRRGANALRQRRAQHLELRRSEVDERRDDDEVGPPLAQLALDLRHRRQRALEPSEHREQALAVHRLLERRPVADRRRAAAAGARRRAPSASACGRSRGGSSAGSPPTAGWSWPAPPRMRPSAATASPGDRRVISDQCVERLAPSPAPRRAPARRGSRGRGRPARAAPARASETSPGATSSTKIFTRAAPTPRRRLMRWTSAARRFIRSRLARSRARSARRASFCWRSAASFSSRARSSA